MFGQRKKQGQQRHQYEDANKYVFKCRLKVDSDDDDVTNDKILCDKNTPPRHFSGDFNFSLFDFLGPKGRARRKMVGPRQSALPCI